MHSGRTRASGGFTRPRQAWLVASTASVIVAALAARVGFAPNSTGYHGLMLCAIIISYQSGNGILPACWLPIR